VRIRGNNERLKPLVRGNNKLHRLKEGVPNPLKRLKLICNTLNLTTTTSDPFYHLKTNIKNGASYVNIHFILYLSKSNLMFAKTLP
jgi:hypothetical protein